MSVRESTGALLRLEAATGPSAMPAPTGAVLPAMVLRCTSMGEAGVAAEGRRKSPPPAAPLPAASLSTTASPLAFSEPATYSPAPRRARLCDTVLPTRTMLPPS